MLSASVSWTEGEWGLDHNLVVFQKGLWGPLCSVNLGGDPSSIPKTITPFKRSVKPCKAECQPARVYSTSYPAQALSLMAPTWTIKTFLRLHSCLTPASLPASHILPLGDDWPTCPQLLSHILCPLRLVNLRAGPWQPAWVLGLAYAPPSTPVAQRPPSFIWGQSLGGL